MNDTQKQDELKAMQEIVKRLELMTEAERKRAMVFLSDRYGHLLNGAGESAPVRRG